MKKEILFFILLLFISELLGLEVIIGCGTSVTGDSDASPVNVWYKSLHGQSVYTKAELNQAGIFGPVNITRLGFNIVGLPLVSMPNFVVRMKHTTADNVSSWINADNLVTVYSNPNYLPTETGWNMYNFSIPFEWNGEDNLLVDTAFGVASSYNRSGTVQFTSIGNGYRFKRNDDNDQTNVFSGGETSSKRPNIKLIVEQINAYDDSLKLSTKNKEHILMSAKAAQQILVQCIKPNCACK